MATKSLGQTPPLIAIVDYTASGKTALAIRLANRLGVRLSVRIVVLSIS